MRFRRGGRRSFRRGGRRSFGRRRSMRHRRRSGGGRLLRIGYRM